MSVKRTGIGDSLAFADWPATALSRNATKPSKPIARRARPAALKRNSRRGYGGFVIPADRVIACGPQARAPPAKTAAALPWASAGFAWAGFPGVFSVGLSPW